MVYRIKENQDKLVKPAYMRHRGARVEREGGEVGFDW